MWYMTTTIKVMIAKRDITQGQQIILFLSLYSMRLNCLFRRVGMCVFNGLNGRGVF